MSETISTTVTNDMRLILSPDQIGREGEHNSAVFVVTQPASLDQYACRAEVQIGGSKTYRLVEGGEFSLTNDITQVSGIGQLQLVYSDGDTVLRKTTQATFHVSSSINAIDPSDPTFADGLAQLQGAAFARVQSPGPGQDVATFYNLDNQAVGILIFPPAGGGDLTEERANGLYLRLSGIAPMQGSVNFSGPNRGVTWEDSGVQGAIYSTGTQLVLRLPIGDPPFLIEPNSGNAASRSPVITQAAGDARYVQPPALDAYLKADGTTVVTGDLRMIPAANIDDPIRLQVGGRQAAVRWQGALILTKGQANEPVLIEDNNGANSSPVLTQQVADGSYLQRAGGQMTGPLISATGSGLTNPGLGIGDNSTGFYRTGTTLLLSVSGALYMQWLGSPPSVMLTVPLNMATQQVTNVGTPDAGTTGNGMAMPRSYADGRYLQLLAGGIVQGPLQVTQTPQLPTDAANKGYVDAAIPPRAPVVLREVGGNIEVSSSGAWVQLTAPITFNNPGGGSVVMCVSCMINTITPGVASPNVRLNSQGTTLAERRAFAFGQQGTFGGFTVQFYRVVAGTSVGPFTVEIQSMGGPTIATDFTVVGGIADGPRSQIAVYAVGPAET